MGQPQAETYCEQIFHRFAAEEEPGSVVVQIQLHLLHMVTILLQHYCQPIRDQILLQLSSPILEIRFELLEPAGSLGGCLSALNDLKFTQL
jgi:hypothetical protein